MAVNWQQSGLVCYAVKVKVLKPQEEKKVRDEVHNAVTHRRYSRIVPKLSLDRTDVSFLIGCHSGMDAH